MSKINIDLKLTTNEEKISKKISGIIDHNRIVYIDDNVKTTILLNDIITLKREAKDYIIKLVFDNKESSEYTLLKYKTVLPIKVKVLKINREDNYLYLKYQLNIQNEDSVYELELKYKKI